MSKFPSGYTIQQEIIAALREPRCYPHTVKSVLVIETHISWVLLVGRYAYKIKKALNLKFLDYTRLEDRKFCCDEEIRLNRRNAPDIYFDTVPIGGNLDNPKLGQLPAVEYAVRMRRFASANLMDRMLTKEKVTEQHIDSLATLIAHFHASLSATDALSPFGTAESIHAVALQNFEQLRLQLADEADRKCIAALEAATEAEYAACQRFFGARHAQGFVRECHGDLHLGNIVMEGNTPVPFDGIEFNPALRWIDVMDEISFTAMDLLHRNRPEFAWRLLNAYLEVSGDYSGISVLRFYLAHRATVRAKVSAIRAGQADTSKRAKFEELVACRSYLALAHQCLEMHRPALIITHGLPGSGKTTFSQFALQQMGAIRIRSDVERKRMFGLNAFESSRSSAVDIYSSDATLRTYASLFELARGILLAGFPVIVDAAFLKQSEREIFRKLAQSLSVPFAIASLHAGDITLRERVRQRHNDASEADVEVLDKLQTNIRPLSKHELACTVRFTTEETPDSDANSQAWVRLEELIASAWIPSTNGTG